MKRLFIVFLISVLFVGFVQAETVVSAGAGFHMASMGIDHEVNGKLITTSYAPAISIDARTTFGESKIGLWGGIEMAFPSEIDWETIVDTTTQDLSSGFIFNGKLGVGYELLSSDKYCLFLGGGMAFNSTTLEFDWGDISSTSFGFVGTIEGNYFITEHIGVTLGVSYIYCLLPLSYDIEDELIGKTSYKDDFESSTALNIRLGVAYRF